MLRFDTYESALVKAGKWYLARTLWAFYLEMSLVYVAPFWPLPEKLLLQTNSEIIFVIRI